MTALPAFFPGQAPIFALPNAVFFPGTRLALHVFEPRYREMIRRALASDRLVAVALLKPGWEANYDGNPPIFATATLGQIIMDEALPDGRYNIVLEGLARFVPVGMIQETPYRIAEGTLVDDETLDDSVAGEAGVLAQRLAADVARLGAEDFRIAAAVSQLKLASLPPGRFADVIAGTLPLPVEARQELLDSFDVRARLAALAVAIEGRLARIEAAKGAGEGWKWN